ncbi:hypothetical protein [Burkholderia dolosa]|uniref:hypothetical protein n=1 Tax=Burkholderia dolosa TaxID=152500 RepID=UPI0027D2D0B5|nr:hypothetical protein [Burkholderia dolosa]
MNKYLARLRPDSTPATAASTPSVSSVSDGRGSISKTKGASVSFVSGPRGRIQKNAPCDGLVYDGALYADGPYLPWGPYLDAATVTKWQRELYDAVTELARLERWPDRDYDHVVLCIERQPLSTLRPDLTHFTERLAAARASIKSENKNEQH